VVHDDVRRAISSMPRMEAQTGGGYQDKKGTKSVGKGLGSRTGENWYNTNGVWENGPIVSAISKEKARRMVVNERMKEMDDYTWRGGICIEEYWLDCAHCGALIGIWSNSRVSRRIGPGTS
jgi:hypothetical protein